MSTKKVTFSINVSDNWWPEDSPPSKPISEWSEDELVELLEDMNPKTKDFMYVAVVTVTDVN